MPTCHMVYSETSPALLYLQTTHCGLSYYSQTGPAAQHTGIDVSRKELCVLDLDFGGCGNAQECRIQSLMVTPQSWVSDQPETL